MFVLCVLSPSLPGGSPRSVLTGGVVFVLPESFYLNLYINFQSFLSCPFASLGRVFVLFDDAKVQRFCDFRNSFCRFFSQNATFVDLCQLIVCAHNVKIALKRDNSNSRNTPTFWRLRTRSF